MRESPTILGCSCGRGTAENVGTALRPRTSSSITSFRSPAEELVAQPTSSCSAAHATTGRRRDWQHPASCRSSKDKREVDDGCKSRKGDIGWHRLARLSQAERRSEELPHQARWTNVGQEP